MSKLPFSIVLAGFFLSLAGAFTSPITVGNSDVSRAVAVAVCDPPPVLTERNRLLPS